MLVPERLNISYRCFLNFEHTHTSVNFIWIELIQVKAVLMHHLFADIVLESLATLLACPLVQLIAVLVVDTLIFFGESGSGGLCRHIKCQIDFSVRD